jgi:anti-sigma28 factor (negative regulator of flagellin synthesis)
VSWQDDEGGTLETKIPTIAAGVIVAGEARFRRSLREAEERSEQLRILEEKRRQEELAARNQERLESLHRSGELLRQAEDIRALVARVRQAIVDGTADVDPATIAAWEQWALSEADKIDPVRSGQITTHLRAPS